MQFMQAQESLPYPLSKSTIFHHKEKSFCCLRGEDDQLSIFLTPRSDPNFSFKACQTNDKSHLEEHYAYTNLNAQLPAIRQNTLCKAILIKFIKKETGDQLIEAPNTL